MRIAELKALARERGLRGYSQMRKAKIIELIRNNQQSWAPNIPPRNGTTRPACSAGPRQPKPTQQEMDIFEQQEMSKSRPQVKSKLNDWYDWLVNQFPKLLKIRRVERLKLLRIRLWGCIIGLLVLVLKPRKPN